MHRERGNTRMFYEEKHGGESPTGRTLQRWEDDDNNNNINNNNIDNQLDATIIVY